MQQNLETLNEGMTKSFKVFMILKVSGTNAMLYLYVSGLSRKFEVYPIQKVRGLPDPESSGFIQSTKFEVYLIQKVWGLPDTESSRFTHSRKFEVYPLQKVYPKFEFWCFYCKQERQIQVHSTKVGFRASKAD